MKYNFQKGQIVHLDEIYNILAFLEDYKEPFNHLDIVDWEPEMSDTHIITKSVRIEVIIHEL